MTRHFIIRRSTRANNWVLCEWKDVRHTCWSGSDLPPTIWFVKEWASVFGDRDLVQVVRIAAIMGVTPVTVDTQIGAHTPPPGEPDPVARVARGVLGNTLW